jgi:hypothetical protein
MGASVAGPAAFRPSVRRVRSPQAVSWEQRPSEPNGWLEREMPKLPNKGGADRHGKKPHARPDRIIEKRAKWEDYLDPDEDPGLLDEEELLKAADAAEEGEEEEESQSKEG